MSTCQEHEECDCEPCQYGGTIRCGGCDGDGCPSVACDNARESAWMRAEQKKVE